MVFSFRLACPPLTYQLETNPLKQHQPCWYTAPAVPAWCINAAVAKSPVVLLSRDSQG